MRLNKKIITKIKLPVKKEKNLKLWLNKMLTKSLKDLKIKKLYGLLVHDTSDILNKKNRFLEYILELKKKKLVSKVGISVYEINEINQVLKFWKPDIIQIPLNIFDQRFLKKDLLKKLKKQNIEIHVRSCFLKGLLLQSQLKIGNFKSKNLFKKFTSWCNSKNISQLDACLNFIKKIKHIDGIVVGFDSAKQLKEIIYCFRKKTIFVPDDFANNEKKLIDPRKWKIN
ncbi:aldo/keto reductase family protein [alpha proteobacterium HIMB5]|nr:aldo/keto reductase family protein [alpha proteobacterium HIMB5]